MPRTDEALHTGMTSVAAKRVEAARKSEADRKRAKQAELIPDEHVVLNLIATERASIPTQLWDLINLETTKEDVKSVTLALKKYDLFLSSLDTSVKQLLKRKVLREEDDE